jgi:hypothetical protein
LLPGVPTEPDAVSRNDKVGAETPGKRPEEGDQGRDDSYDPTLGWSAQDQVTVPCATVPWACTDTFLPSINPPDAIWVISDGAEAVLHPVAGQSDIVYIRTVDDFISVRVDNVTTAAQLALVVRMALPRR